MGDKARPLHKPTMTIIGCVQADVVMRPVTDLPMPGGTLLTEQMTIRVGGAGANAALASHTCRAAPLITPLTSSLVWTTRW